MTQEVLKNLVNIDQPWYFEETRWVSMILFIKLMSHIDSWKELMSLI